MLDVPEIRPEGLSVSSPARPGSRPLSSDQAYGSTPLLAASCCAYCTPWVASGKVAVVIWRGMSVSSGGGKPTGLSGCDATIAPTFSGENPGTSPQTRSVR